LYAGINFKNRKLHPDTLKGIDPPINDSSEWYELVEKEYNYSLTIPPTKSFKFIYIGIEDDKGNVLFRQDISEYVPELNVSFKSFTEPHKWIYWPVDKKGKWMERKDTNL
jgi:hypothetical protein